MRRIAFVLAAVLTLALAARAEAITWSPGHTECPVCKKSVPVQRVASYGSYVYRYPSKYQLVFWPHTDSLSFYFCPDCHYSAFMGEFAKLPADKVQAVKDTVAKLKKPQPKKSYEQIPIDYRLGIAGAVAKVLGRDDLYWCHFERTLGYHLAKLGQKDAAKAARLRSLALAQKLLKANAAEPSKKELTFLIGALQHFTGQKPAALATLAKVQKTPVEPKGKMKPEQQKSFGEYLDELARSLGEMIEKNEKVPE
jgi:transposase-like protein